MVYYWIILMSLKVVPYLCHNCFILSLILLILVLDTLALLHICLTLLT